MVFMTITYVLAVAISTTTPRTWTIRTPTDRAQRDEYNSRIPDYDNDGTNHKNMNSVLVAATRQHNNNSCPPAHAHYTQLTVSRLSRRGIEQFTSSQRRKPCGDGTRSHTIQACKQQHNKKHLHTSHSEPEASASEPAAGEHSSRGSPQEPQPESDPVSRTTAGRRATEQDPSCMRCRRDRSRKDPLVRSERADGNETPRKKSKHCRREPPEDKETLQKS